MQVGQSSGTSDYKKYPISYTTNALSAVMTYNSLPNGDGYIPWVMLKDKTKCLVGNSSEYNNSTGDRKIFSLISTGY